MPALPLRDWYRRCVRFVSPAGPRLDRPLTSCFPTRSCGPSRPCRPCPNGLLQTPCAQSPFWTSLLDTPAASSVTRSPHPAGRFPCGSSRSSRASQALKRAHLPPIVPSSIRGHRRLNLLSPTDTPPHCYLSGVTFNDKAQAVMPPVCLAWQAPCPMMPPVAPCFIMLPVCLAWQAPCPPAASLSCLAGAVSSRSSPLTQSRRHGVVGYGRGWLWLASA